MRRSQTAASAGSSAGAPPPVRRVVPSRPRPTLRYLPADPRSAALPLIKTSRRVNSPPFQRAVRSQRAKAMFQIPRSSSPTLGAAVIRPKRRLQGEADRGKGAVPGDAKSETRGCTVLSAVRAASVANSRRAPVASSACKCVSRIQSSRASGSSISSRRR
jgi:hypothetical protein